MPATIPEADEKVPENNCTTSAGAAESPGKIISGRGIRNASYSGG
ncbi:MAG: hypothetical protein ACI4VM_06905 [Anaerovoracaceae bacterium]